MKHLWPHLDYVTLWTHMFASWYRHTGRVIILSVDNFPSMVLFLFCVHFGSRHPHEKTKEYTCMSYIVNQRSGSYVRNKPKFVFKKPTELFIVKGGGKKNKKLVSATMTRAWRSAGLPRAVGVRYVAGTGESGKGSCSLVPIQDKKHCQNTVKFHGQAMVAVPLKVDPSRGSLRLLK